MAFGLCSAVFGPALYLGGLRKPLQKGKRGIGQWKRGGLFKFDRFKVFCERVISIVGFFADGTSMAREA